MQKVILLSFILFSALTFLSNNRNTSSTIEISTSSQDISLGTFSISLAVKDIEASTAFYQKLGFKAIDNIDYAAGKWLILKNKKIKIGLFQNMIPQNTLTFHPQNARALYKTLEPEKLAVLYSQDLDQTEGPCSFMLADPDGNPILFDQHN